MTFDEWWATRIGVMPGPEHIARAAFVAATIQSAQVARDAAKRYACNKKKGVCRAIADQIEQAAKEQK